MRKYSIKEWAADDQPRKKLSHRGAASLSDAELLAILINTGTKGHNALDIARNLLQAVNHDLQKLGSHSLKDMLKLKIKGLGEAKLLLIAASLELGIRRNANRVKKEQISRSSDMAAYLQALLEYKKQEVFMVVFLNRSNKIIHTEIISEGGITGTVADPRVILKKALEHNAISVILCHNHPSGQTKPSNADILVTQKIKQASSLLDINLLDHIIVSQEGFFSFADEGLM